MEQVEEIEPAELTDTTMVEDTMEEVKHLSLVQPVDTIVAMCCTTFKWESDLTGSVRFLLATDSTFEKVLVDAMVEESSFIYESILTDFGPR